MRSPSDTWPESQERRSRPRSNVHWTVYIFRQQKSRPIETKTQNLSSGGFYCLVDEPLVLGERLCCQILVPSDNTVRNRGTILLNCQAKVLRVEPLGSGLYGIAWLIEDYSVVRSKAHRAG